jgi:hypothetical protein
MFYYANRAIAHPRSPQGGPGNSADGERYPKKAGKLNLAVFTG